MSTSFFYITSAFIFAAIGLGAGTAAHFMVPISVGTHAIPLWAVWTASGAAFLMAYSALRVNHR